MSHQVHWVKGFGRSRQAVLDAFGAQVQRLGHVDNWFQWELSFSSETGVDWPAHLVGVAGDGPVHFLAIDMHH